MRDEPERAKEKTGMLRVNEDHHAEFGRLSLAEMKELIEGSRAVRFDAHEQRDVYDLVERVLRAQRYTLLSKGQRGIVRRYLVKVTGLSRAQITRLIGQWMSERKI